MNTDAKSIIEFSGYSYAPASRELRWPDGTTHSVSPMPGRLLEVLGEQLNSFVPKDYLIRRLWPGEIKDDSALTALKSRLVNDILGNDCLIESKPRLGYRLIDNRRPEQIMGAGPFLIFPGALRPHDSGETIPSWIGCGTNDSVDSRLVRAGAFQKLGTPSIPVVANRLQVRFRHRVLNDKLAESYWTAAIPFGSTNLSLKWLLVDIRPYTRLCFDASFEASNKTAEMLLGVRLEDGTHFQRSKSLHNQTGWYPEPLWVGRRVKHFSLELANYDWSVRAWPDNTDDVDRQRMLQVDLGQDDAFANAEGLLEVTNLRLERF